MGICVYVYMDVLCMISETGSCKIGIPLTFSWSGCGLRVGSGWGIKNGSRVGLRRGPGNQKKKKNKK